MRTAPVKTSAASVKAAAICTYCDINIKRRAFYTELARQRGATIQEVAVATACDLLRRKVGQGDYYKLPDGEWRKRAGDIALPAYCG